MKERYACMILFIIACLSSCKNKKYLEEFERTNLYDKPLACNALSIFCQQCFCCKEHSSSSSRISTQRSTQVLPRTENSSGQARNLQYVCVCVYARERKKKKQAYNMKAVRKRQIPKHKIRKVKVKNQP